MGKNTHTVITGHFTHDVKVGNGCTIVGPTDANGNTIYNTTMAIGRGAKAGQGTVAIGTGAGAGVDATSMPKNEFNINHVGTLNSADTMNSYTTINNDFKQVINNSTLSADEKTALLGLQHKNPGFVSTLCEVLKSVATGVASGVTTTVMGA